MRRRVWSRDTADIIHDSSGCGLLETKTRLRLTYDARMNETQGTRRKAGLKPFNELNAMASQAAATGKDIPAEPPSKPDRFGQFAAQASSWLGSKWAFVGAILVIVVWAFTGPLFHFSDTWQLVINTGTTIVTFLMVFLIQNTQNRDARAINLKLNELIRAIDAARDQMIDIENLSDVELKTLQTKYEKIKADAPPDAEES
jgi:low affinity Fe/Cu permease